MTFRPRPRNELLNLPDEKLIEYSVAARDAGETEELANGVAAFVCVRLPMVRGLVARRISDPELRQEVVNEVMASALESAHSLRASHVGEFVNWLKTIVHCRCVDHIDRQSRKDRHELTADSRPGGDESGWAFEVADLSDEQGAVATIELVGEILAARSPLHRRAIQLKLDGYPAIEISAMLAAEGGITPANVDKVFSRFRRELRDDLGESDG